MVHVLVFALLSAAPAAPAPAGMSGSFPPDLAGMPPDFPWEQTLRNTAEYQRRLLERDARQTSGDADAEMVKRLSAARAHLPPSRHGLSRLLPPAWPDAAGRRLAADDIETALSRLLRVKGQVEQHLDAVEATLDGSKEAGVLKTRLAARRKDVLARIESARSRLVDATAACHTSGLGAWLNDYAQQLSGDDAAAVVDSLLDDVSRGVSKPAILGTGLTYVHGTLTPSTPSATNVAPAYSAAGIAGVAVEDVAAGREVELSKEVLAKAQSLPDALACWDFVRNSVRLEWYLGNLKASTETLRTMRGNDADATALLVALLRAKQTPARFVRGTIELPLEKVADSLGLLDEASIAQLYSTVPGAPAFHLDLAGRERVLKAFAALGIPFTPVPATGTPSAVRVSHVWAEAWLPYGDYRGAGTGTAGRQWVPLDVTFAGGARAAAHSPATDGLAAAGQGAQALMAAYLVDATAPSPLDFVRAQVAAGLSGASDAGYPDALRTVTPKAETLDLLPGSLPYTVVSVQEEAAFLPEAFKHRLRVTAGDAQGVFLDATLPVHQVLGHRAVLQYRPAAAADELAVALAGGRLYGAPAALVEVKASVRVDGVDKAVATRAVPLGADTVFAVELLLPDGTSRRLDNHLVAGNLVALGLAAPTSGFVEAIGPVAGDGDGEAARFLFGRAVAYANAWTAAEEELAQLTQVVVLRPTASVVFVENQLQVESVLGVPTRVDFKGVEMDADWRTAVPLELVPGRAAQLLELSGYQGSFLEAKVLADGVGARAVSATEVIREAHRQGMEVLTLTAANQLTDLPRVTASADVQKDVADQLSLGRTVIMPIAPLVIENWMGTGYISTDPQSHEAGYFLSGIVSGGQTVVSPRFWTDSALVAALTQVVAPMSTDDLSQIARIVKVNETDLQSAVVGSPVPLPLAVYVTTLTGVPVRKAPVTFTGLQLALAGDLPTFSTVPGAALADTVGSKVVETDATGRAEITAWPRTHVNSNFGRFLPPPSPPDATRPNWSFVGVDQVTASVLNTAKDTVVLADPFVLTGLPDVPARLNVRTNKTQAPAGIDLGAPVVANVVDRFDNWVSNVGVEWRDEPAGGRFVDAAEAVSGAAVLWDSSDARQTANLSQISSIAGTAVVAYVTPLAPGPVKVYAKTPTLETSIPLIVSSADGFLVRAGLPTETNWDGIHTTSFPVPIFVQVFRGSPVNGGSPWTPVTGPGGDIASLSVVMKTKSKTGANVFTDAQLPSSWTPPAGITQPPASFAFWPKYRANDERQSLELAANILVTPPGGTKPVAANVDGNGVVLTAFSGKVKTTPMKWAAGRISTRLGGEGPSAPDSQGVASVDDVAVGFFVENPSATPVYCRLTVTPSVAGDPVILPLPSAPRKADDPSLLAVPGHFNWLFEFDLAPSTSGGKVKLEVFAPDAETNQLTSTPVATSILTVQPHGSALTAYASGNPRIILPVRNYASAKTPKPGALSPPNPSELPMISNGTLRIFVTAPGRITVGDPASPLSVFDVQANNAGANIGGISQVSGVPAEVDPRTREIFMALAPSGPGTSTIPVQLDRPPSLALPPEVQTVTINTVVDDAGALPVGHVFVKDVSVVDGHLTKQATDIHVQGRGPPLDLHRTYTSRGSSTGPMGSAWTHSLQGEVLETIGASYRYLVMGGEATGQVFTCTAAAQKSCTAQVGYHGTLRSEEYTPPGATIKKKRIVYRSKGGVEYRYGDSFVGFDGIHYPLQSITDTVGNTLDFEYQGAVSDELVSRVWEAGNARFLEFEYEPGVGTTKRLAHVRLMLNPPSWTGLPVRLPPDQDGQFLGVCIAYTYDAKSRLTDVDRYDGQCVPNGPSARYEAFTYDDSPGLAGKKNNLLSHTDPDGIVTEYQWYTNADQLPGEGDFALFGDKSERVKAVVEPGAGSTVFKYSLVSSDVPGTNVLNVYNTKVSSPRPGVPDTIYWQEGYGISSAVTRPLHDAVTATTVTQWDGVHVVPLVETDARSRQTVHGYDDFGNRLSRTIPVGQLQPSDADTGQTEPAGMTESWGYDPTFSTPTSHTDANGRLTQFTVDSPGSDPRAATYPLVATGLTTMTVVAPGPQVFPAQSSTPIVTTRTYCDVTPPPGRSAIPCSSVLGAVRGDLVESTDANGNVTQYSNFDVFGNAQTVTLKKGSTLTADVVTTRVFDNRSRMEDSSDTLGHKVHRKYDALDRIILEEHQNVRTEGPPAPGTMQTFEYYAGGQLKRETNANGLIRDVELDGRGRVHFVKESGASLPNYITETLYDEAGNRRSVTDRRGVKTEYTYDFADRPIQVTLSGGGGAGVAGGAVGQNGVISKIGYDAVGNVITSTDLHGHTTTSVLDSLYRVVRVKQPTVPGPSVGGGTADYIVSRQYDGVGNKLSEEDGNHHVTAWAYDALNRVVLTTDALGRVEARQLDGNGNVTALTTAPSVGAVASGYTLRRTTSYDALNRPLDSTQTFPRSAGLTPAALSYLESTRYEDATHRASTRDARGFVTTRSYDDLDRLLKVVVDDGNGLLAPPPAVSGSGAALNLTTRFGYDNNSNRTQTVDPLGRTTVDGFDALDRKVSSTLPLGVTESWGYDGDGRVISHTDRNHVAHFASFDLVGRARSESVFETVSGSAELQLTTRTYEDQHDAAGLTIQTVTDADGRMTTSRLDALHREVQTTDALQKTVVTAYDAVVKRQVKDRKGFLSTFTYDAVNRLTWQVDSDPTNGPTAGLSYTQRTAFDDVLRKETLTDRSGIVTVREKDGLGRIERSTRGSAPDLRVDVTEYDAAGNPVRAVDPNLHVTVSVFDGANRLLTQTRGFGTSEAATTTHSWDNAGQELELKGPRVTGVSYDVRTTYDDLGRAVRVEDALAHITTRAYDGLGNLVCEKAPKGNEVSPPYAHGTTGLSTSELRAAACAGSFVTKREYDELSRLLKDVDATGGETSFVYSRARDVLAKQDAAGHLTTYEYDKLHRRTGEFQHLDTHGRLAPTARVNLFEVSQHEAGLPTDGGMPGDTGTLEWHSTYDANGNLEDLTDPRGLTEHHVYGLLNRLATTTYPQSAGRSLPALDEVVYTYTKNGSVKTATEKKTTAAGPVVEPTVKVYDGLERLKSETRYDSKVVASTYDAKGNRLSVTEGSTKTSYTFDALDRLSTATTWMGDQSEGTTSYDYFPDGLLAHTRRPQSTRLDEWRCYDAAGRLSRIATARGATGADGNCNPSGGSLVSDFVYQYDANGNRATLTETRTSPLTGLPNSPGEVTTYGYDDLDRLVRTDVPEGTTTLYGHDAVGNRVGERKGLTVAVGLFATFLSVSPTALTSDVTAVFNTADWLISRTDALDPSKNVTFGYDLAGNVTSKTKSGGPTRTFQWDARNTLTAVFDDGVELGRYDYDRNFQRVKRSAGGTRVEYILDDSFVLSEADGSQTNHPETRRYHYSTQPLEVVDNPGTPQAQARLLGNDAQGSVSDFIDFTGTVTAIRQYDAWGNFRSGTAPTIGEAALAYTGHQFDAETGLIYARARYYDSEYGIFLSRDTVEGNGADAPSLHRYLYTRGNPLRYTDPSGHGVFDPIKPAEEPLSTCTMHACEEPKEVAIQNANNLSNLRYVKNTPKGGQEAAEKVVEEAAKSPGTWARVLKWFGAGAGAGAGAAGEVAKSQAEAKNEEFKLERGNAEPTREEIYQAMKREVARGDPRDPFTASAQRFVDEYEKPAHGGDAYGGMHAFNENDLNPDHVKIAPGDPNAGPGMNEGPLSDWTHDDPEKGMSVELAKRKPKGVDISDFLSGEGREGSRKHANDVGVVTGVIDRPGAAQRRRENLKDVPTKKGYDRDEYTPAVIKPDKPSMVDVDYVKSSDNRSSGAALGVKIKPLPDGTRVYIIPPKK